MSLMKRLGLQDATPLQYVEHDSKLKQQRRQQQKKKNEKITKASEHRKWHNALALKVYFILQQINPTPEFLHRLEALQTTNRLTTLLVHQKICKNHKTIQRIYLLTVPQCAVLQIAFPS